MFQLFGILPLVKILTIVLFVSYFSFLIGKLITNNKTNNRAIDFLIGLFFLLGLVACYTTSCRSVFLPVIIGLPLIFKTHIQFDRLKSLSIQSLKDVLKFGFIFCVFLLIELFRQDYFSKEFINSSWADYSFYIITARNILQSGIESAQSFLNDYSISSSSNIYHYFDLYLLSPVFALQVQPLLGYLFYYLPFAYSIAAFCMLNLFDTKFRIINVLISILLVHLVSVNVFDLTAVNRFSIIYCHKAAFFVVPILLFQLNRFLNRSETLMISIIIMLAISPILFLISIVPIGASLFFRQTKFKEEFINLFKWRNLVVIALILFYIVQSLFPLNDNSGLFVGMDKGESVMNEVISVARASLSSFKLVIQLVLFYIVIAGMLLFNKITISVEIILGSMILFMGLAINLVFYDHFDGGQFFVIPLVGLLALVSYFCIIQIFESKNAILKSLGIVFLLSYTVGLLCGGYSIYTTPRALNKVSVSYSKKINEYSTQEGHEINSVFFPSLDYQKDWLRSVPFMPFDVGYIHYFQASKCIQPFTVDFFLKNDNYKANALNLISTGPFQTHCNEMKLNPTSYYDKDFELGITSFIKKHSINTLIFDKSLEIPEWMKMINVKLKITPKEDYDKHIMFII